MNALTPLNYNRSSGVTKALSQLKKPKKLDETGQESNEEQ